MIFMYLLEGFEGFSVGDMEEVPRHPQFRLFACMNPATDVGKRNLPAGLRARFTEIFVPESESKEDLAVIVRQYTSSLGDLKTAPAAIVDFYLSAKALSGLCAFF